MGIDIAVTISENYPKTVPGNNASHVQDDQKDQHSQLSSLVDGKRDTQQSSVHSPAKDAKTSVFNREFHKHIFIIVTKHKA